MGPGGSTGPPLTHRRYWMGLSAPGLGSPGPVMVLGGAFGACRSRGWSPQDRISAEEMARSPRPAHGGSSGGRASPDAASAGAWVLDFSHGTLRHQGL